MHDMSTYYLVGILHWIHLPWNLPKLHADFHELVLLKWTKSITCLILHYCYCVQYFFYFHLYCFSEKDSPSFCLAEIIQAGCAGPVIYWSTEKLLNFWSDMSIQKHPVLQLVYFGWWTNGSFKLTVHFGILDKFFCCMKRQSQLIAALQQKCVPFFSIHVLHYTSFTHPNTLLLFLRQIDSRQRVKLCCSTAKSVCSVCWEDIWTSTLFSWC